MEKDFQKWHALKADLHIHASRVFFHEGEVWWSALGANVGFEEDGKHDGFERPVLIFKKFNKEIFLGLPVTTKEKKGKHYFNYSHDGKEFAVILSQIRLLDAKRLKRKIRFLSKEEFIKLKEKFAALLC